MIELSEGKMEETTESCSEMSFEELSHLASNDAMAISIGVHILSAVPEELLTPQQLRALKQLSATSNRLVNLIEAMKQREFDE